MKHLKLFLLTTMMGISMLSGCSLSKKESTNYAFIKGDNYLGHVIIDDIVYTYNKDNTATILCSKNTKIKHATFQSNIEIKGINYIVSDIFENAFKNCIKLEDVILPSSITSIGNNAFSNCTKLKTISLNEGLENIGNSAFENCQSLQSILLPNSLKNIGYYSFASCNSLQNINVKNDNKYFYAKDGVLFYNDVLKLYPSGKTLSSYKVDDNIAEIDDCAFAYCKNIENIDLNKIKKIGKYAFYSCDKIKNINFGSNLEIISDGAFSKCTKLHYVNTPLTTLDIGNYAFYGCEELYTAKISNSVINIGCDAFSECNSLILVCDNGVSTSKWDSSWNGGRQIYWGATKDNTIIVDGVFYILENKGATAISHTQEIKNLLIPNYINANGSTHKVVSIARSSFEKDKYLQMLLVGDNVASINDKAFYQNSNLETILILNAPTRLESDSFNECPKLKNIILGDNIEAISSEAFREIPSICFKSYNNAFYLGNEKKPYEYLIRSISKNIKYCNVNEETKIIADAAFQSCVNLKELNITPSVIFIGNYTLYNCPNLKYINFNGSKEDFKKIKKGMNWKGNNIEKAICLDGELLLTQL